MNIFDQLDNQRYVIRGKIDTGTVFINDDEIHCKAIDHENRTVVLKKWDWRQEHIRRVLIQKIWWHMVKDQAMFQDFINDFHQEFDDRVSDGDFIFRFRLKEWLNSQLQNGMV